MRALVVVVLVGCWTSSEQLERVDEPPRHAKRAVHATSPRDPIGLGSGTIEGVITDIWTMRPIARVTVDLMAVATHRKRSTITDLDGRYQFTHLEAGDYTCELSWDINNGSTNPPLGQNRPIGMQQPMHLLVGEGAVVQYDVTTDLQLTTIGFP